MKNRELLERGWNTDDKRFRGPDKSHGRVGKKSHNPKLRMQKEEKPCCADYPDCECGELPLSTRAWRQRV